LTLDVPVFVVINKIDLCSKASIQQTVSCPTYLLKHGYKSSQFEPFLVQSAEDLVKAAVLFAEKM
jgi:GTPase